MDLLAVPQTDRNGSPRFMANFDLVRRKGTLVNVGNASGPVEPIPPLKLSPKNLKLVRPRLARPAFFLTVRLLADGLWNIFSMPNYIVTPEESEHYSKELFKLLADGIFKIRIPSTYPFTTEGARGAQKELTTPGGKLSGKILIKIADE
jgi:NADPH:quinone reductase